MKRRKFVKGNLYYIKFLDHTIGGGEEATCEIAGWTISDRKSCVVLNLWNVLDVDVDEDERELVTIVKGTIIKSRKITI